MGACRKGPSKGMALSMVKTGKKFIKEALMMKPIMAKTVQCFMRMAKFAILGISRGAKRSASQKSGMLMAG